MIYRNGIFLYPCRQSGFRALRAFDMGGTDARTYAVPSCFDFEYHAEV